MTAQAGDTLIQKRALRRELRLQRAAIGTAARRGASRIAAIHAMVALRASRCRRIAVYLSAGSELDTAPLIAALHAAGLQVFVPLVLPRQTMSFVALRPGAAMRRSSLGIAEPVLRRPLVRRRQLDAVLMPLVGFDDQGFRLGAGGGYYDRWLARPRIGRKPLLLGYAYACQRVEQLPRDPWDRRMDAVITEQGMLRWPTG